MSRDPKEALKESIRAGLVAVPSVGKTGPVAPGEAVQLESVSGDQPKDSKARMRAAIKAGVQARGNVITEARRPARRSRFMEAFESALTD